jgi:hypothetical protein
VLLQPISSSHRGARQDHVREAPRGVVEEEIERDAEVGPGQPGGHALRIGERREHVRAEEQEHAHRPLEERLGDPRHLVGNVPARRAPLLGDDAGQGLTVGGAAVARAEAAAGDTQIAGECRETSHGPAALPAVPALVHRATAEKDHRRSGGGVSPGQRGDAFGRDSGDPGGPRRRVLPEMGGELVEPDRVPGHEVAVEQSLLDDHLHHRQSQRRVGPRAEEHDLVRQSCRLGLAHVDHDDVRPPPLCGVEMASACSVDWPGSRPRAGSARSARPCPPWCSSPAPGQAETEGAEAPADDGRTPPLAAVEVREAAQEMRVDPGSVVVGEHPVPGPEPHRFRAYRLHPRRDAVQRLLPGGPAKLVSAFLADQWMEEAIGIVEDLPCRVPPDAEKPAAVGLSTSPVIRATRPCWISTRIPHRVG